MIKENWLPDLETIQATKSHKFVTDLITVQLNNYINTNINEASPINGL